MTYKTTLFVLPRTTIAMKNWSNREIREGRKVLLLPFPDLPHQSPKPVSR